MFYIGHREIASNDRLVPGLTCAPGWLSAEEQADLVAAVEAGNWALDRGRRIQRHRASPRATPGWVTALARRAEQAGFVRGRTAWVEVVEFPRGEGDPLPASAGSATLILASPCVLLCENPGRRLTVPVLLEPGSLVAPGPAAAAWRLTIPDRRVDQFEGRRFARGRRIALRLRG